MAGGSKKSASARRGDRVCGGSVEEEMVENPQNAGNYPYGGGPICNEVLVDYEGHVAKRIWEYKETRGVLTCINHYSQVHDSWHYSQECQKFREKFDRCGLKNLVDCAFKHIDKNIVTAFVERWHPETSSFHLPWGEMTITPHDVVELLGLTIDGKVCECPNFTSENAKRLVNLGLGIDEVEWMDRVYNPAQGFTLTCKYLRERFKLKCTDESTDEDITHSVNGYCLYVLGNTAICSKSGNRISVSYCSAFCDGTEPHDVAWGTTCLVYLFVELGKASRADCQQIAGYLTLLEAWVYAHFYKFAERVKSNNTYQVGKPLALKYKTAQVPSTQTEVIEHRKFLDTYHIDHVIFDPYHPTKINKFAYFRGIIFCMDLRAPYMPDRVLRQFGYRQVIPRAIIPCKKSSRSAQSSRFKQEFDILRHFQQAWDMSSIQSWVTNLEKANPLCQVEDGYYDWYKQVSHPLVNPPPLVGATDHLWNAGVVKALGHLVKALELDPSKNKRTPMMQEVVYAQEALLNIPCRPRHVLTPPSTESSAIVVWEPTPERPSQNIEDDQERKKRNGKLYKKRKTK